MYELFYAINQLKQSLQPQKLFGLCCSGGMGRGIHQRPPMAVQGEWGMQRPNSNPVTGPGHPGMARPGQMGLPMINRSNSVPANPRSMLQQQLMDMGMTCDQ